MVKAEDYTIEIKCTYKGEIYRVRDNGFVLREARPGKKVRPSDEKWTEGTVDTVKGYLTIAGVPIHRIVAVAFLGECPGPGYVVDHIDTNRQNNRPQNLRWVTRLDNVLLNPITRKKIEFVCGVDIYTFLENPAAYRDKFQDPNFSWMRSVTQEEAAACLTHMRDWITERDNIEKPREQVKSTKGFEKIFEGRSDTATQYAVLTPVLVQSLTPTAIQRDWKTPTEFPSCPITITEDPLQEYFDNLKEGAVFTRNQYGQSEVVKAAYCKEKKIIVVISDLGKNSVKNFGLTRITFEGEKFVHTSISTFFMEDGAEKYFTLEQGLEWTGGDVFDDYC